MMSVDDLPREVSNVLCHVIDYSEKPELEPDLIRTGRRVAAVVRAQQPQSPVVPSVSVMRDRCSIMARRRLVGISIAAVFCMIVFGLWGQKETLAIALAQARIAFDHIDVCRIRITNHEKPHLNLAAVVDKEGHVRVVYEQGLTQVYNQKNKAGIAYDPETKSSWDWTPDPRESPWMLVERMLNLPEVESTQLGAREIDGKSLVGLQIAGAVPARVWIEPDSKLPRRIEQLTLAMETELVIELDYPKSQPSLFEVVRPQGYSQVHIGPEHPVAKVRKGFDITNWPIIAGAGCGPIQLSISTMSDLEELLGKPSEKSFFNDKDEASHLKERVAPIESAQMVYPSIGFTFQFDASERLKGIVLERQGPIGHNAYAYPADRGVKFGDSKEMVKTLYGEPEWSRGKEGPNSVFAYGSLGIAFSFRENEVDIMFVEMPKSE